jgi:hypothetical protein
MRAESVDFLPRYSRNPGNTTFAGGALLISVPKLGNTNVNSTGCSGFQ